MQNGVEHEPQRSESSSPQFANHLLNAIPDPVLILDTEWKLQDYNPAAAAVFGFEPASRGNLLDDLVQSPELIAFVRRGYPLSEWRPAAAASLSEFAAYTPRLERLGDGGGYLLYLRDASQLRKLTRNQQEFVRIVSHDLRSPLTSMQGFASMLESHMVGELNERQHTFIEKILSGIAQITAIVDNIQDAGRFDPETGFYELQRAPCDVSDIVLRIVQNHLVPAEKQELKISVSVADDVPVVSADGNMLERAITNLVDNAIKYTPNGGEIDVSVRCVGHMLCVSVKDSGLGIRPEHQKQLFQRHVRIPRQEHKKIKGTGLGLFIVRSVARQHGGDAWVESVEGQGSTFSISIPLEDPGARQMTHPVDDTIR